MPDTNDIKQAVRARYAGAATRGTSCCGAAATEAPAPTASCGCGSTPTLIGGTIDSTAIGYSADDLAAIPQGADLGLGCGNPLAMLELQEGETVLDLGSGGGIDCFIAAGRVGPTGRVIGVDMTPEMLDRARRNAAAGGHANVEFRLGEIEHLPVSDASVDAIISNCVINLVPDKRQVFADAFRVLRSGGRLSVSDIVLLGDVPRIVRDSMEAYVACMSGAVLRDEYLGMIAEAGFTDVRVTSEQSFDPEDIMTQELLDTLKEYSGMDDDEIVRTAELFQSVRVSARKP